MQPVQSNGAAEGGVTLRKEDKQRQKTNVII